MRESCSNLFKDLSNIGKQKLLWELIVPLRLLVIVIIRSKEVEKKLADLSIMYTSDNATYKIWSITIIRYFE